MAMGQWERPRTFAQKAGGIESLSAREKDCLYWVSEGKTDGAIGIILGISERTVRFHMNNVKLKLNVSSRAQAVKIYVRSGLDTPPFHTLD